MSIEVEIHGYGSGHFKRLEGRLMTQLETLGLAQKQEEAVKSIVRQIIWNMWDIEAAFVEEKKVTNPTAILEDSVD